MTFNVALEILDNILWKEKKLSSVSIWKEEIELLLCINYMIIWIENPREISHKQLILQFGKTAAIWAIFKDKYLYKGEIFGKYKFYKISNYNKNKIPLTTMLLSACRKKLDAPTPKFWPELCYTHTTKGCENFYTHIMKLLGDNRAGLPSGSENGLGEGRKEIRLDYCDGGRRGRGRAEWLFLYMGSDLYSFKLQLVPKDGTLGFHNSLPRCEV